MLKITVSAPFRDVRGRFAKATAELKAQRREMLRDLGRVWVGLVRIEAPKRTGKFARGHIYRTLERGDTLILRGYAPQPLAGWITEGTRAHRIPKSGNKLLAFFWERGPKGPGMYFFMHVFHPGTKANPYQQRALARFAPYAQLQLRRICRNFVLDLTR